ncbi:hypothetical protein [Viridibacillus arvi]|uniref:hypothetical protein n=1 Tax=Viridibacillus arvi TaxID=263475 RepID=UPI00187B9A69|nr:hypothetical protein [Viridibacillus sp. JNUCC-6]QOV12603.1 hypothetical protein JNUCC6_07570 [Viridibacillus sp. JNUCC-6]
MKKIGLLLIGLIFLLVACSEDVMTYEAKASDFEGGFEHNSQMIIVNGEELMINGNYYSEEKQKTVLDKVLEADNEFPAKHIEKIYKNAKIKTKKDRYYITADDGISLEFQKIGDRIIVDEEGAEFYTMKYP